MPLLLTPEDQETEEETVLDSVENSQSIIIKVLIDINPVIMAHFNRMTLF